MTTREFTAEGMLRAGAVLTRAGPISYLRSEIGLDGTGMVTVDRTIDTLRHPSTLASLRGAPITVGHPKDGVTPENFQDVVVGAVAGEPRFFSNSIIGDLLIGDKDALKSLDDGVTELSIGYRFALGDNGETVGPLICNHIALVEEGRAGSAVRVLDSAPALGVDSAKPLGQDTAQRYELRLQLIDEGKKSMAENMMTKQDVMDATADAIDAFMKKNNMDGQTALDMRKAMGDAMKPMMDKFEAGMKKMGDQVDEVQKAADERKSAQDAAAAESKANDARKVFEDSVRTEERERSAIVADALPLVPEDLRAALSIATDVKDILVAAVGDTVPNAKDASVDYLRGVVSTMRKVQDDAGSGDLPAGVVAFDSKKTNLTASDARAKAAKEFVDMQAEAYKKAGGI